MAIHRQSVEELQGYLRKTSWNGRGRDSIRRFNAMPYVLNFSLDLKRRLPSWWKPFPRMRFTSRPSRLALREEPVSYVIEAMGKSEDLAKNSIRLSFSYENTLEEAKRFLEVFSTIMQGVNDR
jgi:cysteine desulfurase